MTTSRDASAEIQAMERAVRRANVVYDLDSFETGIPHVPPYVANGILGGCFDAHGFQTRPNTKIPEGRTILGYNGHHHARASGQHVQFPLTFIRAHFADAHPTDDLVDCRDYRQELDLLEGTLETRYDLFGPTRLVAYAPLGIPNLFVLRIERRPDRPGRILHLELEAETSVCQNNDTISKVDPVSLAFDRRSDHRIDVVSTTNATRTRWAVDCRGAHVEVRGTHVHVRLDPGPDGWARHTLLLWVERADGAGESVLSRTHDELHAEHAAAWRRWWASAWVDLPEERAQAVWTRTAYYLGCSLPTITARPVVPTGLNSNIWGYYFPQDVYYIVESAPRLGHAARARLAAEYWIGALDEVRAYTRRFMGVEGAYWPWTPPFQDWDRFEVKGPVGPDSYELHNPAYVLAILWHLWLIDRDRAWLARALPVIQEVFRFYRGIATRSAAGTWDLYHEKARGQDEASSTAGHLRNLLCAGYSAEYSARAFVAACEELGPGTGDAALLADARDLAANGVTRASLLRPEGWHATYEGDSRPPGQQKHPVQLNPIAYLPMTDHVERDPAIAHAWRERFELTQRAKRPMTLGWTIGEFALASARMRDPVQLERDLRAVQPCRAADPRWIQFYESSFQEGWHLSKAYYLPMSGLYLQAFTDCLVQDWRGFIDLCACLLPGWAERGLRFHGLRARGDVVVSGEVRDRGGRLTLLPGANAQGTLRVRVGIEGIPVHVSGHASGPAAFAGGETVELGVRGVAIDLTLG